MENATSRAARHPYTVPPTADAIQYGSTSRSPLSSFIGGSPCPETKIRNSRRKRHHGFAVQLTKTGKQSVQAPVSAETQFVKPPKPSLYRVLRFSFLRKTRGIRGNRGTRRTRQKQIQLQPSKAELNKNNASRRDKLKPYVLEPTPQAKRYPQSKCCDFYPWKGNHPEDRVTDYQAKHGHSDRLLYNKNREQLSARQFLGPAFKHRNGLPWLSYLYKDIMSRRQQHGTVTTPSTFKPPPRVTLPEQKREAWLRDLANPLVPLRKLSRTIPHGLKGPPLLEQCTAKNIPTARAVWFVRCVGANELRGLRRKGVGSLAVGGESKWIKEWTGQLAQFLEKTVGACMTMPDDLWRSKMHYSIRLAAYLYAEHLLDRTGFLEWYLSFVETCSIDVLPLALVLATVFWDDLTKLRRLSRRFAEILLKKSEIVIDNNADNTCISLIRRLSVMVSNILLRHRESLVGSGEWERLSKLLALVDGRLTAIELCIENVALRNALFDGLKGDASDRMSTTSSRRKAVDLLDNLALPFNIEAIYQQLETLLSGANLVSCIFEWAVTSLRTGQYRVYLGADLLRYAASEPRSLDIQTPILEFLANLNVHTKVKNHDVFLLIAELVHTADFSIGTYLRWIIAKGVMSKIDRLDEGSFCCVRLLAEIPIHSANTMHRNLRNRLLDDRFFDCNAEERSVIEARELLSSKGMFNMVQQTQPDKYMGLCRYELEKIRSMTRTAKSELALWLRTSFGEFVKMEEPNQNSWQNPPNNPLNNLPATQVILIRQVLEEMGDMAVLVEIIKIVLASENWDILTLAADTIAFNLETFCVLHSLDEFIRRLYTQYKKLRMQQQPPNKTFLSSFLELLYAAGTDDPIRHELESELVTYDLQYPRTATVSRSPISESMDDIFDGDDVDMMDSNEEIELLWNIGAVVDKPDLSRIFETTVSKMETSFEDADNQHHILCATNGFTKLREFNTEFFDELSQRWVDRMQSCTNRMPLFRAFSSLIAASCLKIEALVDTALKTLARHNGGTMSAFDGGMFVVLVLDLIVHENPFETALSAKDIYTLKRKRKIFAANSAIGILQLFRQAIELCGLSQDEDLRQHVLRLVSSSSALELLRTFATQNLDLLKVHVVEPLLQEGKPQYTSWLLLLVDNLLDDNDCNDNTEVDAHVQVARLLDLANDFSIDLCKLKMQIILNSDRLESDASGGDVTFDGGVGDVHSNTIARSIIRGIASTSQDRRKICTDLITVLNKDCAAKLRADVEELFLDCNSFLRTRQLIEQLDLPLAYDQATSGEALARAFLAIIDATSTASVFVGSQFITSTLVERIATLLQIVASTCCDTDDDVLPEFPLAEFRCWLVLFLRLVVLHRPAFLQQSRGGLEQARMLARLCCLLQQDVVHNDDAYFEMVLGVASSFADGLPDDTHLQLRRYIKGKRQVPMGAYILGAPLDGAENLRARQQKGEIVEFALKPWERLAEPAPNFGENDVTLSLVLFRTRRF